MNSQWTSVLFWVGAILMVVVATVVYQPAAARSGSLLVWTRHRVYVLDLDTLELERIAPATPEQIILPSPGCFGQVRAFCWVVVDDTLYRVELGGGGISVATFALPAEPEFRWAGTLPSWSPDGLHLAYYVTQAGSQRAELRVYEVTTGQLKIKVPDVDPELAVAWTAECVVGLMAPGCKLGYKQVPDSPESQALPALVGYAPAKSELQQWAVSPQKIFELRWSVDGTLLYSRPKRHFLSAQDHAPAYDLPSGAQLANMSPDGRYTVYYQPFTLKDCQAATGQCLHLGVWLLQHGEETPKLIYNIDLSQADQTNGLNFVPTWSPSGRAFVFFQEGRLIHYDLAKQEATIWYKPLLGDLRALPVFSPNEEAVTFVDDQVSEQFDYRLLVINPNLEPIEHVLQTEGGFRLLAWLQ